MSSDPQVHSMRWKTLGRKRALQASVSIFGLASLGGSSPTRPVRSSPCAR
jgi:hypothetical protein